MDSGPVHRDIEFIVPVRNASAGLAPLCARLVAAASAAGMAGHILFIDDGSTDDTWTQLRDLAAKDARIRMLRFSRSFGRPAAVAAGLACSQADYNIIMDASSDLSGEFLAQMMAAAQEGHDVVHSSSKEQLTAWERVFYRTINRFSPYPISASTDAIRLVSAKARGLFLQAGDRARFDPEIWAWIGLRQTAIPDPCPPRKGNRHSPPAYHQLLSALIATGTAPLLALGAGTVLLWALGLILLYLEGPVSATMAFAAGWVLIAMTIVALYAARLGHQARRRPTYLIAEILPEAAETRPAQPESPPSP